LEILMMQRMRLLATTLTAAAALALFAGQAHAGYVIGGQAYSVSTPTEVLSAAFTTPNGGVSANFYSGLVQMTVSGSGQSAGSCLNDAFYVFTCGIYADGSYYQLTSDNAPLVGLNPAQDAKNFIVYDADSGSEVLSRPYVPLYRADHTYTFVVDLALLGVVGTSRLHFGVSDGQFGDNSGSYSVQISQLTAAVPEPGTLALVAASGLALLVPRRRHTQQG
jgi:hypothetical protein